MNYKAKSFYEKARQIGIPFICDDCAFAGSVNCHGESCEYYGKIDIEEDEDD